MEKNGDPKKMVDLSPFFLFEAAGDSEGDLDDTHHHNIPMMMEFGCHDDHDEDAESCSYDVWDAHAHVVSATASTSSHIINEGRNDHHVCRGIVHGNDDDDDDGYDDDNDDDDDDDGDELLMKNLKENASNKSEIMSTANTANSTRKYCVDSSEGKKLSEKERSRLFWETCLAS